MVDVLLQIGIAKLLVSCILAGLAIVVQRRVGHPAFIHRLWLLVLVALLLPAVVAIPVLPGSAGAAAVGVDAVVLPPDATAQGPANPVTSPLVEPGTPVAARITDDAKAGLVIMWLLGTALLLGWTLFRVLRFRHWLLRTSQPAPQELRDEVSAIGRELGLTRTPAVHTTSARVSPMVCWAGGRVRIVVPSFLLRSLERHELRAMLAHELAHVRRRDHLVRWIEWLACSAFWWNPVAWWARREVRAAEEASCDALGAAALECSPRDYARSLLRVVDLLSRPPTPPIPAFASGAANCRSPQALERRIRVLTSAKSTVQSPRWVRRASTAAAVCILPLGLVYCGFADQPMPTAPKEAAELVTLSEEPADKQQTRVVFTYNMTSNGDLSLAPRAYDILPTCHWVFEPDSDGRKREPLKDCVYSWQEWLSRLKEARAETGGMRLLVRVSPQATAGQVWQLQGLAIR